MISESQKREWLQDQLQGLIKMVAEDDMEKEEFMELVDAACIEATVVPKGKIIPFPYPSSRAA